MSEVTNHGYELVMQGERSGIYQCWFLELPGSDFSCENQEDIFFESEKVLRDWSKRASDQKMVIPKSGAHRGFNGAIRIRIARTLYRLIDLVARERDVSVSALVTAMLKCGADWLLHELKIVDGPVDVSLDMEHVVHRKWSADKMVAEGHWIQKISPDLHYTLAWLAENEGLSISALTQFLLGRVFWATSLK